MDLEFTRGDTYQFKFKLINKEQQEIKLSEADNLYMTVKKDSNTKKVEFQKKLGQGINYEEDGYYHVTIESKDTSKMNYGTYNFDIELKTQEGKVKTIELGSITLTEEYTFAEDEN